MIMPIFFARFLIIFVFLLLLILLRKFLKRVIFIIVLLGIAFFIYGLFSPSRASKLRYTLKTFPQQIATFFGGEEVLPYDEYQTTISLPPSTLPSSGDQSVSLPLPTDKKADGAQKFGPDPKKREDFLPVFPPSITEIPLSGNDFLTADNAEEVEEILPSNDALPSLQTSNPADPVTTTLQSQPPKKSPSSSQTPSGLTAQEIYETETLFQLLLQ